MTESLGNQRTPGGGCLNSEKELMLRDVMYSFRRDIDVQNSRCKIAPERRTPNMT